jgi:hypothetical protein
MKDMSTAGQPDKGTEFGRRLAALVLVCGLAAVFVGQSVIGAQVPLVLWAGPAFVGLGLILLILAMLALAVPRVVDPFVKGLERLGAWLGLGPSHALALLLAPLMSVGAWAAAGEANHMALPALALGLWLAAIVVILTTARKSAENEAGLPGREWIAVGVLVIAAFLVRAVQLGSIPWVLAGDEASSGWAGIHILDGSETNPFAMGWYSFPALYFVIPAASIKLFGQTIAALRFPSTVAGALTVLMLYVYARRTFGLGVAAASAVYLAFFHFHVHFSRIGLNNIWDPLVMVIVWVTLWHGWRHGDRRSFVLSGVTLGLGFYLYTSFRLLLVIIPIWLLAAFFIERPRLRGRLPGLTFMALSTLVVALPLGLFYLDHMDQFFAPMQRVSILGPWLSSEMQRTGSSAGAILLDQFKTSTLAFTTVNLRHWYAIDHPMLFPLASTFFVFGVLLLLTRLRDLRYIWLAAWMAGVVVAGALSESTPASQRYVMAAPAVCLLIGIGLSQAVSWLAELWPTYRRALVALAGVAVVLMCWQDAQFYFGDYTPSHRFSDQNTEIAQAVGHYLASKPDGQKAFFFGSPRMGFDSIETLPYLAPQVVGVDVEPPVTFRDQFDFHGPATFIFTPWDFDLISEVQSLFPGGQSFLTMADKERALFIAYEVK